MNVVIINTMKTHYKICPASKIADTVNMSPLTPKTQFKEHSWPTTVKITTTNGS